MSCLCENIFLKINNNNNNNNNNNFYKILNIINLDMFSGRSIAKDVEKKI